MRIIRAQLNANCTRSRYKGCITGWLSKEIFEAASAWAETGHPARHEREDQRLIMRLAPPPRDICLPSGVSAIEFDMEYSSCAPHPAIIDRVDAA